MAGETEWEDVLIKHGIIEAPKKGPTEDELALQAIEEMKAKDPLADKSLAQLDAMEDEVEEDTLEKYREKRLAEMKAAAERNKFGQYRQISETQFVQEVSRAGDGVIVVLHLLSNRPECELLSRHLARIAPRFRAVKFLRIVATDCIKDYPERNTPTLLIYRDGDVMGNLVGLEIFGGLKSTPATVEWVLSESGVLETEMESDPREKLGTRINRNAKARRRYESDSDSDSDSD